ERYRHLRTGPRPGVAPEEQKLVPGLDLSTGGPHAGAALVRGIREPAGRVDVIAEPGPFPVQHAPGRVHRADHLDARDVLGDEHRIARLENHVVPRAGVAQRLRQIDVDPTRPGHLPVKPDAVCVRLRRQTARALYQVGQPIALRLQRVRAGITYLTRDGHRPLQLELRLPEDQYIIERLELHFRCTRRRSGETRRTDVAPR